jgi:hypothetical protein
MGDDHDAAATLGQLLEQEHDRLLIAGVESRRRLVEEEQGRLGQQLQSDARPLPLPAGETGDHHVGPVGEAQFGHHLVHPAGAFRGRHVQREAQFRRELERPSERELGMEDVLLGHVADAAAQLVVGGVEVAPVVEDRSRGRRLEPVESLGQGGLARSGGTENGQEAALVEREADVVEEALARR